MLSTMVHTNRWVNPPPAHGSHVRCLLPGHPDVVVIHATRTTNSVPYLSEIVEHTTHAATGAPAGEAEISDDNATAPAKVRFVLAVTGGVDNDGSGGGADSSKKQRTTLSAAEDKDKVTDEDPGRLGAVEAAHATTPQFNTVEGRPDAAMLRREVPDIADRHVMLCGPDAFMAAMEEALKELGVPSSRVHSEGFYF